MKSAVALLLFLAMQLPLMNQWGAVAYYRVNQDYIAKNLCENRDKPMLNCNGQCYLAKKLKAAEESNCIFFKIFSALAVEIKLKAKLNSAKL